MFVRLGYLPIGISVSAGLIRYDVRYTISNVANNPPANVSALIREAIEALDPAARTLLAAMSACASEGFGLDLAAVIANLDEEAALAALQILIERSLAEELDRTSRRYGLHAMVRAAGGGQPFGRQHAEAVHDRFETWEENWRRYELDLPDFQVAFEWALGNTGEPHTDFSPHSLAYLGFALEWRIGRLTDAFEICQQMVRAAERGKDSANLQAWLGNQAPILKVWGRLEEALARLKKQEDICLELGNKDSLRVSYGNQALILQAWGRLEEALALHKKEEHICHELGNKDGLQRSYGNQALILKDWGRLEEALALLKKQEDICLELDNKDGLQCSYGNQALILKDWGRLEEALALHRKEEDICLDLGSKRDLGYCYWTWGLLERARANSAGELQKLSAALAIFQELKMPREQDAVQAELAETRSTGTS